MLNASGSERHRSDDRFIGGHFTELLCQHTSRDAEVTVAANREVAYQRANAIKQANITTTKLAHCINACRPVCCRLPTRSIALLSNTLHPCEGDISSGQSLKIQRCSRRSQLQVSEVGCEWIELCQGCPSASDLGARAIQEPNGLRDSKTTTIYTQDFNRGPYGIASSIDPL